MSAERDPFWTDLGETWRADPADAARVAATEVETVRARAATLQRTIRWRNARELVGCAVLMALGAHDVWAGPDTLTRIEGAVFVCAAGWIAAVLQVRGRPAELRPTATATEVLSALRHELERQAAVLASVWSWYLAPLWLGVSVKLIAQLLRGVPVVPVLGVAAGVGAGFLAVAWMNLRAARRLRAEAARLIPR